MSNIDQDQREEILADYDVLISKGKKHKTAREEVINQWKFVRGWNESKIYNLIQHEWRLRKHPKGETEEAETTETEVKAGAVEAETTEAPGTAAAETTGPTLLEREAKVQQALEKTRSAGWELAVSITEIHDFKCYPGSEEKDGWPAYMLARWGIRRAQAFNLVAWVHNEITLTVLPGLGDETRYPEGYSKVPVESQSTTVDSGSGKQEDESQYPEGYSGSQETPAATGVSAPVKPVYATERESRAARTKHRKIKGKLNEDDLDALREAGKVVQIESGDYISRKEADRQVQEGDLVKIDDRYYRSGDLNKSGSASETSGQAEKEEPESIPGPFEKDIKPEEPKEDSARAKILERIGKLISDCRGWSTNEYYQLLMELAEMIGREIKLVEGSNT